MTKLVEVQTACPLCSKINVMMVEPDKLSRWIEGELIQNVWPEWTPEEREMLMTGTCTDQCWKRIIGKED